MTEPGYARWLAGIQDAVLSRKGRTAVLSVGLVGMFCWMFVLPDGHFPMPYRIDLDVYRTGARVLLAGGDLYGDLPALAQGAHLPFTYPPIAAVVFVVFAVLPLPLASALLTLASIACLAGMLRIVWSQVGVPSGSALSWLTMAACAAAVWLGPVRDTLAFGQINIVLVELVLLDAINGRDRWWGGALIGLAIAIKLTPVVFLLLLFLRRDWRAMAMALSSFVVFTLVGHLAAPADSTRFWTDAVVDPGRVGGLAYSTNQSINGLLLRLGVVSGSSSLLWFVGALLAGLGVAAVAWRLLRHGHDLAATIAVGFSALLCSPVSWSHHWVWAAPLSLLMLVWAGSDVPNARVWRWLLAAGIPALVLDVLQWLPHGDEQELGWSWWQHALGNWYLWWGLAVLAAMGWSADRLPAGRHQAHLPTAAMSS